MNTLLFAFFRKHMAAFVLIASVLMIGIFIYSKGWADRGEKEKAASQTHTINRTSNRGEINEKVQSMHDAGICGALGGVYRNDKCE